MTAMLSATSLREEAAAIVREWERGAEPDALAALARQPELRGDKGAVLDLAYAEYCLRFNAGERPQKEEFVDRFPTYRMSLWALIGGHKFFELNISTLSEGAQVRWPAAGERLDDFTLLRELGRGAFARVYLALEESTGDRPVALKLSAEGAAEARTLGRLTHPNIVPILSSRFMEDISQTAVCMPFRGSATLIHLLDHAYPTSKAAPPRLATVIGQAIRAAADPDDPIPFAPACDKHESDSYVDGVVRLAAQIADALAFLHKEGVCHRDLKPSNVLLSSEGQALLLDFNLSADARASKPLIGGTVPYMAPEQLRALVDDTDDSAMDERVDLYALGVILYELLTGKSPYGRGHARPSPTAWAAELLRRQRKGFLPLRTLNPDVDHTLARLIEDCLAFDPGQRPVSAALLAAEFHRYLALPARLRRAASRRPKLTAALTAMLFLAVGGAAAAMATQDPPHLRAYKEGRAAFVAGDYAHAENRFDLALRDCPDEKARRKYLLARGAAALRQGEADDDSIKLNRAQADFVEVNKLQADGPTLARIGYCSSRLRQHETAIRQYDEAEAAGFTSAGLYNDRGFSAWKTTDSEKPREDFDAALKADANLQAALYNRALFSLRGRECNPVNCPSVPETALEDMRRAVELGPEDRLLFEYAATIYAYAARDDLPRDAKGRAAQSLIYLRQAYDCGTSVENLEDRPIFKEVLGAIPEFQALQRAPRKTVQRAHTLRLVDPAPYSPE
jgi:eukaryotic-like serine/threonine-protein kinase